VTGLLVPLGIGQGDVVAAVGAGGKTTLIYALAREARAAGLKVLVTTTTHMAAPSASTAPLLVEADGIAVEEIRDALSSSGLVTILGRRIREDKIQGLAPERVDALAPLADLTLIEADGARGRSLKAPAPHEPVVPASATLLIVLAALDVLGSPVSGERVHRSEIVARQAGLSPDDPVDEDALVRSLAHPESYPSRLRPGLRALAFLNKVEDDARRAAARRLADRLCPPYGGVVAGSARGEAERLRYAMLAP
jgi:probable selenium-dependent hydroxylase accessory protein YqeC